MTRRFRKPVREHPAIVQRRLRGYALMVAGAHGKREEYEARNPESDLLPLPKPRGPRKPSVGPSEHQEQSAVISWWRLVCTGYGLPLFALFAVPNGGARDAITGARLKAEGVRRGVFDLMLAAPRDQFHGLFLEMKVDDNKLTPDQQDFEKYLLSAGYCASAHWSADSAIAAIKEYLR